MNKDITSRFYAKVTKTDNCWLWDGAITDNGYGTLSINNKTHHAHRISWLIHNGPVPIGMCVCHKCDIRNCVNPEHLFLGTVRDNMHDMIRKGRKHVLTPKDYPQAKLDDNTVIEIRGKRAEGISFRSLARMYGVDPKTIRTAVSGISWKHVPMSHLDGTPAGVKE